MIINEGAGGGLQLDPLSNPGGASQALNGYQYYNQNGDVVTGNITTRSLSTPSISVSSSGLITASVTQSSGYVSSATKSATKQLTTQSGTTITPGTSQKTAVSSGRYTTGTVYVAGDSDLVASNIRQGVNIFGVTGTAQTIEEAKASVIIRNEASISRIYVYYINIDGGVVNSDRQAIRNNQEETIIVTCGTTLVIADIDGGNDITSEEWNNRLTPLEVSRTDHCVNIWWVPYDYDGGATIYVN